MSRIRKVIWASAIVGIVALMVLPMNGVLGSNFLLNQMQGSSGAVVASKSLMMVPPPSVGDVTTEKVSQKDISSSIAQSSILGDVPVAVTGEPEIHPGLASDTSGWLFGGYALHHTLVDSDIVLVSSVDGGTTWVSTNTAELWQQLVGMRDYPAVDYWGSGHRFVATFTPDPTDAEGSMLYVVTADDPSDTGTWSLVSQDCTWVQIHDRESNDIAGYSKQEDWWYGIVVSTADSDYDVDPYTPCTNVPFFNLPYSATQSWAWWFDSIENCHHACIDLVQSSGKFYAAWDYLNESAPEQGRDILLVTGDADDITTTWSVTIEVLGGAEDTTYPDVAAAENGYVYIVMQANDSGTGDKDVICYYSHDNGATWAQSTIAADPGKEEMYPSIVVDNGNGTCLYTVDGNLYVTETEDGGVTWSTPRMINDIDGTVVSEYHMGSISTTGGVLWMDNRTGNNDIYFDVTSTYPILNIKEVSARFGKITVLVENTGTADAIDVPYEISIDAFLILTGGETTGVIDSIPFGNEKEVRSKFVLGFGKCTITATVGGVTKTASGFVLGPFFLGVG